MRILLLLLFLTSFNCIAQLGKTTSEILYNEGDNYTNKDIQNDFTVYSYLGKIPKLNGEQCGELVSYFIDNEYDICFKVTYAACASAANTYVKFFNEVAVKINANKWKDYSNNSIYTLTVEGQFSYVENFYDSE